MYFKSDVVEIHWDAGARAVVLAWTGFAKGDAFKEGLEKGLELVKAKRATRWVGDVRKLGPVKLDDQEWVNTNWFPRLLGAGLTHMAIVMPEKAITKMSVGRIMQKVEGTNLVTVNVATPDEGLAWVKDPSRAKFAA